MKTLLTTVLSFTAFSVSATVYNSDGTVQNIQAIYNIRPSIAIRSWFLRGRLAGLRGVWNQIRVIILTLRRLDLTPFCSNIPPSAVPDFGLVVDRNRRPDMGERNPTRHTVELVSIYFLCARRAFNQILFGKRTT
jgi:hypothetical protein